MKIRAFTLFYVHIEAPISPFPEESDNAQHVVVQMQDKITTASACVQMYGTEENEKWNTFNLKKEGHDDSIDFIKGICILLVILTHCIPAEWQYYSLFCLWGAPAVPIFLIIQTFHAYKRGLDNQKINLKRILKRIIYPFLLTEMVIIGYLMLINFMSGNYDIAGLSAKIIRSGGFGPGSYYPYIYIQFCIILPLIASVIKKIRPCWLFVFFILLSEMIEIGCSMAGIPEWIYRLSFFRYTFLIYLGYILAVKGYEIKWQTIIVSVVSIAATMIFYYWNPDLTPWFHNSGWKVCHWICYIYIAYLMMWGMKRLYLKIAKHSRLTAIINKMGIYSYEIFLLQMVYFTVINGYVNIVINHFFPETIATTLSIVAAVILSIVPIMIYKHLISNQKHAYTKTKP